jgi:hypothetical protein
MLIPPTHLTIYLNFHTYAVVRKIEFVIMKLVYSVSQL